MSNHAAVAGAAGHRDKAEPARADDDSRRPVRRMQRIVQLAWLLPLAAFALIAALLYRQAFDDAAVAIYRASRIAQEQALKLFETNAMLLQRMLDLWGEQSDEEILARGSDVHLRLKRMVADLPQVQGLFMDSGGARALTNSIVFPRRATSTTATASGIACIAPARPVCSSPSSLKAASAASRSST